MKEIKLVTDLGSCSVYIGESMARLGNYCDPGNTVLIVDENVYRHHQSLLGEYKIISLPPGEKSKSIESYSDIFGQMLEAGIDRSWKLVAIGGGITTDLGGFVASTYFRGISYGFVSTSLLGQVDAAVGGKNGINYKGYKNLIGIIRQPEFVLNDITSLKTLPRKELVGGLAEVIKYGFIRNPEIYYYLTENYEKALGCDLDVLGKLVYDSVRVKVEIVESDVSEQGDRKLLNFGHTFAHAIEKLSTMSHGEAVSVGMILATRVSLNLGFCEQDDHDRLQDICAKSGLPVSLETDPLELLNAMQKDKKKSGDSIQLILLRKTGDAFVHTVKLSELKSIVHDLY